MEFPPTSARLSPAEFVRRLRRAVEEHPAVRHPFLKRFAEGRVARWQIWGYASQHYHLVSFFPAYLEAVAARTPDPAVRHVLREIVEEERMRPQAFERSHAALYRRFLRAIGFPEGAWERVTLLPETQAFVHTHLDLTHRSWLLGLGAVGPGHEWAIPRMFGYLVDGLECSLRLDREALEYFHLHIDSRRHARPDPGGGAGPVGHHGRDPGGDPTRRAHVPGSPRRLLERARGATVRPRGSADRAVSAHGWVSDPLPRSRPGAPDQQRVASWAKMSDMRLMTAFVFDAAHRILGHPGKCAYLHGHTYGLEVTVSAERLNELGMVLDVDDLRALVKKAVLDRWDHATLLWAKDPLAPVIEQAQTEAPEKVVRLGANPTAESLAWEAWQAIQRALPARICLERVAIRESATCSGELTRGQV